MRFAFSESVTKQIKCQTIVKLHVCIMFENDRGIIKGTHVEINICDHHGRCFSLRGKKLI